MSAECNPCGDLDGLSQSIPAKHFQTGEASKMVSAMWIQPSESNRVGGLVLAHFILVARARSRGFM